MGQNRNDTAVQRAAKRRRAERTRCPSCGRAGALRIGTDQWADPDGTEVRVTVAECRWRDRGLCDYRNTVEHRSPAP